MTLWIGARYGQRIPLYFVCGYPRSGTSWMSDMTASYLKLPRPIHYLFPISFPAVIHTHATSSLRLPNCFLILRDGRDVMVSLYYYACARAAEGNPVFAKRFQRVFGRGFEPDRVVENLPRFIEDQLRRPVACRQNWADHTLGWLRKARRNPSSISVLRYEDLLADAPKELARVLKEKNIPVDPEVVTESVARWDFQKQMRAESSQRSTVLRSGRSGDWKRLFSRKACEIFFAAAQDALVEAGYEADGTWLQHCEPALDRVDRPESAAKLSAR